MPHCVIEYANELEASISIDKLLEHVYKGAVKSGLFEESSIKTRAIAYEYYQIAGQKKPFIHLTLKIMSGRNRQERKMLSNLMLDELKSFCIPPLSLTIEIVEVEKATYSRLIR